MSKTVKQWREELRRAPETVRFGSVKASGKRKKRGGTPKITAEHIPTRALAYGIERDTALDVLAHLLAELDAMPTQ